MKPAGRQPRSWAMILSAILLAAGLSAAAMMAFSGPKVLAASQPDDGSSKAPTYVGSETCIGCHQATGKLWQTSQHKHAMAHANEKTVLGDFNNTTFDYYGLQSRFYRKDGKFFVETDGPDGKLAPFEVKYSFGLDPLQQYLIEFPDGRLQALSIAWNSRPKEKGGQRWFHLYPNEQIKHDDILHWTKLNQNWNFMCAECHSTGVRKNYDAAQDRFKTTWAEIDVGCEACHGQGSRHVGWAKAKQSWWPFNKVDDPSMGLLVRFNEREGISWAPDPRTGNPLRSITPATLRKEVETCGLCHARRSQSSENWVPGRWLSETHLVSPISRGLYHADGQMQDEVYNYGSFKQSKMFAAGVTCSDCHDPHSAKLKFSGDNVCLQCHDPAKVSTAAHRGHADVKPPPGCVSCHMPARTYMVIDKRHDHSFRIPRPDLSVKLGTPNACNDCHTDKSPAWAAAAIERWHGPDRKGFQKYAAAFHAAWNNEPGAGGLLAKIAADGNTPAFARASALAELSAHRSSAILQLLAQEGLSDPDPMVRIGTLDMLDGIPARQIWPIVAPLLSDSNRGVRIRAAALLASVPPANQPPADRARFERAAAEFLATQRLNADRPEARATLGNFYARQNRPAEAEAEYKAALRLSPQYAPAAINLADLYRNLGKDGDGEKALRTAIAVSPRDGGLHYALGLTLTRLKQPGEALTELKRAHEVEPDNARYAYVYAVALHSAGKISEAMAVLEQNLARHPRDNETLSALVSFNRERGDLAAALKYAEQLAVSFPQDNALSQLINELRRQTRKPKP